MKDFPHLLAAWEAQVARDPGALALHFEGADWTREALDRRSRAYGSWLAEQGVEPGERVLLVLDNGPDFLALFLGCHRAGAVPVPVSPKSAAARFDHLAADSGARLCLGPAGIAVWSGLTILPQELPDGSSPECVPSSLALLQYTSGSTGSAKGVMVSQRAVLANIDGFASLMGLGPHSRFSSLLPLFHDMGLVCFGLAPLLLGYPLFLYRQEALSLYQWLEGIGRHRITHTGGPDSLLRIACRVVEDPARCDLSSLRMFICGSEPILGATLDAFGDKFGVRGALRPAYGLAELTLCATLTPAAEGWKQDGLGRVSSGRPIAGVELRVDASGEILVRSAACMEGYWGQPGGAALDGDGFLATGDLGYLDAEGHLYVLGRRKNLLIRAGAKYCPHDLEAAAQKHPAVRRAAAVQPRLEEAAEDPVVAVLEVDRLLLKDPQALEGLAKEVRRACGAECALVPDVLWTVPGGRLPVTENGKLRHAALAEAIRSGAFQPAWSYPPLHQTAFGKVLHAV